MREKKGGREGEGTPLVGCSHTVTFFLHFSIPPGFEVCTHIPDVFPKLPALGFEPQLALGSAPHDCAVLLGAGRGAVLL